MLFSTKICFVPAIVGRDEMIYDFLSYIFSVSEEYKDYTFDYDDMAG